MIVEPFLVSALAAIFDDGLPAPKAGEPLPPYWHLAACATPAATGALGADGHPKVAVVTAPDGLPRRMFAGGSLKVAAPLLVGERLTHDAFIEEAIDKVGRSGPLRFVTVMNELKRADGSSAQSERQRIVYRAAAGHSTGDAVPRPLHVRRERLLTPGPGAIRGTLCADPVALQRFSAVTSNAHRIHYDHPYATTVEGYPDLVVHGPLVLLALLELVRLDLPSREVTTVDFVASAPVFCGDEVALIGTPDGDTVSLRAQVGDTVAMTATVQLSPA